MAINVNSIDQLSSFTFRFKFCVCFDLSDSSSHFSNDIIDLWCVWISVDLNSYSWWKCIHSSALKPCEFVRANISRMSSVWGLPLRKHIIALLHPVKLNLSWRHSKSINSRFSKKSFFEIDISSAWQVILEYDIWLVYQPPTSSDL